ncbi:MAG TPA: 1-acyl-sn-glycerol-3-phosphate acyltransferase, partial [Opitutaceae bacterium]
MPLPFFRRRSYFPSYLELPARLVASLLYRVRASGAENVPAKGGVLLIANHISYVDPVVLQLACGRPIRFMAYKGLRRHAFFNWCFDHSGCIDVASQSALEGVRAATEALKRGEVVCLFPEGHISRTGQLLEIKKGFEVIARRAGV